MVAGVGLRLVADCESIEDSPESDRGAMTIKLSLGIRPSESRLGPFEIALKRVLEASDWTLVHGTIIGPDDGPTRLVHAWLEREGRVHDPAVGRFFSAEGYTRIVGAVAAMRYRHEAANQWLIQTKHAGPWDDCCLADEAMRDEFQR